MPDSIPPSVWGPAPFDEWDLDTLLSGHTAGTPPALRQVADALIALRAAPTPAELEGEAMIMAEFSALAEFSARGLSEAPQTGGHAHTLVLPVVPPDAPRRRGARHRSRRTARPLNWKAGAVIGAAAAAVIVTLVAFPGSLPGPIKSFAHISTSSPSATTSSNSGSQSVAVKSAAPDRTARSHPVSTPTATTQPQPPPPPSPSTLCRTLFEDFRHFGPHSKLSAESALYWQISKLAGGPGRVFPYCAHYVKGMYPWNFSNGQGSHLGEQGNTNPAQEPGNSTGNANASGQPSQQP